MAVRRASFKRGNYTYTRRGKFRSDSIKKMPDPQASRIRAIFSPDTSRRESQPIKFTLRLHFPFRPISREIHTRPAALNRKTPWLFLLRAAANAVATKSRKTSSLVRHPDDDSDDNDVAAWRVSYVVSPVRYRWCLVNALSAVRNRSNPRYFVPLMQITSRERYFLSWTGNRMGKARDTVAILRE